MTCNGPKRKRPYLPIPHLAEGMLPNSNSFGLSNSSNESFPSNHQHVNCISNNVGTNKDYTALNEILLGIRDIMDSLYKTRAQEQNDSAIAEEWKIVARVIDRVLGLLYCLIFFSVFAFVDYDIFK